MKQVLRYGLVSVGGYLTVILLMYFCVNFFHIPKTGAFVLVYALVYVAQYFVNLRYLFGGVHAWSKVVKFVVHIFVFLIVGVWIFNVLIEWRVSYLLAAPLATITLFPLRFLSFKFLVFK